MRKRDVFFWTPDPIGEARLRLEEFTVDSEKLKHAGQIGRDIASGKLYGVAQIEDDGSFMAYDVTDHPLLREGVIAQGQDLVEVSPGGGVLRGLRLTLSPERWQRNSSARWHVLDNLGPTGRAALSEAVIDELARQVETHYITNTEYEHALSVVDRWISKSDEYIQAIGAQPYNIDIPGMAAKLSLVEPVDPKTLVVGFRGRYLDWTGHHEWEEAAFLAGLVLDRDPNLLKEEEIREVLRSEGWDGVFQKAGWSSYPDIVLWNSDKIDRYGGWSRG